MQQDLVSVIMPAYNAEKFIGEAIDSLILQTYPSWELILVNDGSQDGTANIAAAYHHPAIQILHQKNTGEAVARNHALDAAQGEWIAFLDADDIYHPEHLELAVGYLKEHPDLDAVYTDGYHIDQDGQRMSLLSSRRRGPFRGWIYPEIIRAPDVFGPPGCIVLKAATLQNLRFDPLIFYGTDWDFLARYAESAKFGYIDQRTYIYRVHTNSLTNQIVEAVRTQSWIRMREKAIKSRMFSACPTDVQEKVFYDLLIILLFGKAGHRESVIHWREFKQLPDNAQAKLLRLLVGSAILEDIDPAYIQRWLQGVAALEPTSRKGLLLSWLYSLNPSLCRLFIAARRSLSRKAQPAPF